MFIVLISLTNSNKKKNTELDWMAAVGQINIYISTKSQFFRFSFQILAAMTELFNCTWLISFSLRTRIKLPGEQQLQTKRYQWNTLRPISLKSPSPSLPHWLPFHLSPLSIQVYLSFWLQKPREVKDLFENWQLGIWQSAHLPMKRNSRCDWVILLVVNGFGVGNSCLLNTWFKLYTAIPT
jgi:hypothetical protein